MPWLIYQENGTEILIPQPTDRTILEASLDHGIPHYHSCGGKAQCSTCRIWVLEGQENLTPSTDVELNIAQLKNWSNEIRLACQARILGDVKIKRLVMDEADLALLYLEVPDTPPGYERNLVVMFCDLEGFTGFTANNLPYDVVHILNRYYQDIGVPILANEGYIDKYIGDGIMVLFGLENADAKTNCLNAIRASLRIRERVNQLNQYLLKHFNLEFKVRIGLHYGSAIIGEVGHSSKRQLTALGNTVNIASRIESANKEIGTNILASRELIEYVKQEVKTDRVFHKQLRGQDQVYELYEVVGFSQSDTIFLVQSTFEKVLPKADSFSDLFYQNLFLLDPSLIPLFENIDMTVQKRMLMNMIGVTVRGLNQFDEFIPMLRQLGKRHQEYQVKSAYYPLAGQALLAALADYFGDDFTPDVKQAWKEVYELIAQIMTQTTLDD